MAWKTLVAVFAVAVGCLNWACTKAQTTPENFDEAKPENQREFCKSNQRSFDDAMGMLVGAEEVDTTALDVFREVQNKILGRDEGPSRRRCASAILSRLELETLRRAPKARQRLTEACVKYQLACDALALLARTASDDEWRNTDHLERIWKRAVAVAPKKPHNYLGSRYLEVLFGSGKASQKYVRRAIRGDHGAFLSAVEEAVTRGALDEAWVHDELSKLQEAREKEAPVIEANLRQNARSVAPWIGQFRAADIASACRAKRWLEALTGEPAPAPRKVGPDIKAGETISCE